MIPSSQVQFVGRRLQKRAPSIVSNCWHLESRDPRLVVRSKKTPSVTEMGRVSAVLASLAPEGMTWLAIRYGALTRSGAVPSVTNETTWHATEDGLLPHKVESISAEQIRDIEAKMSLVPTPTPDE